MALKSSVHPVVILLVWILLIKVNLLGYANAQNAYRPYRPISNIFGSLFRPGVHPGPHLPPGKKQYFLNVSKFQYSHHSIKCTGSIKQPALEFFKNTLLNVPYDPKFW